MEPDPDHDPEESSVGITEFIRKGPQLSGIQKYLVSDFIVNQIDQQGVVVQFTEKPDLNKLQKTKKESDEKEEETAPISFKINEDLAKQIEELLGEPALESIRQLYEKLDSGEKVTDWATIVPSPTSKEQRGKLHEFVRERLHNIDSKTDKEIITLFYTRSFKRVKRTNDYLHFKLLKSNIDTMSALFRLSKIIGCNQKLLSVAGLKDKRGITTQKVSLYNCQPNIFEKFYKVAFRNREMWVGDILTGQHEPIALGQLQGNRFSIVIRFIKSKEEVLEQLQQNLSVIREKGFINYFGMQRFGRGSIRTHSIGIEVLKKNWQGVVETLLMEDTYDNSVNLQKKELYEKGEYRKAERLLGNKHMIQKNLFAGLARLGTNYCSVFESLPRNSRMIYGHALQSYIWNKATSRRIKEFGPEIHVGDLVAIRPVKEEKAAEQSELGEGQEPEEVVSEEAPLEIYEVALVTAENIEQFSIRDVVVPMVGSTTQLPAGCLVGKYIEEELQNIGLSFENFSKGLPKSLLLPGGHRKILVQPANVDWQFISYSDKSKELQNGFYYLEDKTEKAPEAEGKLFALRIVFDLPKSAYATMLMREVLKMSSSFEFQQRLNKVYNQL